MEGSRSNEGGWVVLNSAVKTIAVPFISGDGVGPEIMASTRRVIDRALEISYSGKITIAWEELLAGEAAHRATGEWLPKATLNSIESRGVALKGPLMTPVGGGIRSLNVAIRQALDLYASVRPVRYFKGVPSPVKHPERMNMVIFRENTEDVYRGVEWKSGSKEVAELLSFLKERMGVEIPSDSGIGIKPISRTASKRLIRAAVTHAIKKKLKTVTLVHKGNIMKFTEGAFRDWGYELAREEFSSSVVTEAQVKAAGLSIEGKVLMNDRIADNMFQQILMRPEEYSVLATPNLNGDYLADACAAQVGGLGLAPGANIGEHVAVFEAVHGTASKYAGKDRANPGSLVLSGAMMLEHLGLDDAAMLIVTSLERTLAQGVMTQDLARLDGEKGVGMAEFSDALIGTMG
jgi:isocitrate dehydrogenase